MSDEKDLGSRVYVLESKQGEYDRRQQEQEDRTKKQEELISQLASSSAVIQSTLSMLMDRVVPEVNEMKQQVIKNTTVTKAAMWLAGTVITVAITAVVAMI